MQQDVRDVTRLAWEAAELSHDRFTQMQHLATGLRDLIGGQKSFFARLDACVVGEVPVPEAMVPCRDPEPNVHRYLQTAGRAFPILSDPFMDKGRAFEPVAGCVHWSWVHAQITDWQPYADAMGIIHQARSRTWPSRCSGTTMVGT